MKQIRIVYIATLYSITFLFLSGYDFVLAQQDSNTVVNEYKIDQNTMPKNSDEKEELNINISDELGVNSFDDLSNIERIVLSLLIFIACYYLLKIITKILRIVADKKPEKRNIINSLIPIIRLSGWAIILYTTLGFILHPPFGTLVAISVFVGIAIGLASQDLVKNIFGGIIVLFDRPFRVGDKIKVGDNYGQVVAVGLRFTRIVTSDDSVVSIPNSVIMNQPVANSNSGEPNCQVVAEVFLPIGIDTVAVRELALEVARISKYVYLNKPVSVLFFNEVKEKRSYLKMRLKAYVMDIKYEFEFKSEMTEIIINELLNEGLLKKEDVS